MSALKAIASGSVPWTIGLEAAHASASARLAHHSITAATNGTERLSSRRIGIDSTAAAATAASTVAATSKATGGAEAIAGRVQSASAMPPAEPNTTKAIDPATDLSRFQGSVALGTP